MRDSPNVLSNNIRYLRKQKGLNQDQLANALNIKRSNIAAYEAKNVEPRLRIILSIAKFFNVDLQTLLEVNITDSTDTKEFGVKEEVDQQVQNIELANVDIQTFTEKSMKIRKILIGFKAFYTFRKSNLKEFTPNKEKIMLDIDNFILLMEHLLTYNESIIKAVSSKQTK